MKPKGRGFIEGNKKKGLFSNTLEHEYSQIWQIWEYQCYKFCFVFVSVSNLHNLSSPFFFFLIHDFFNSFLPWSVSACVPEAFVLSTSSLFNSRVFHTHPSCNPCRVKVGKVLYYSTEGSLFFVSFWSFHFSFQCAFFDERQEKRHEKRWGFFLLEN